MKIRFLKKKKVITRMGHEGEEPYLVRWNLFECPLFSIKIHKILLSDDDCLHDHPWAFISIILRGGYVEYSDNTHWLVNEGSAITYIQEVRVKKSQIYHPGNILYRRASYKHRLEIHQPAWTLVFTFKKIREWGFHTPQGWIHWSKYNSKIKCD